MTLSFLISTFFEYFIADHYLQFLMNFKRRYDCDVILLADRGYRFIRDQVEAFGLKIIIPAIQQVRMRLGDEDSQPNVDSQSQRNPTSPGLSQQEPSTSQGYHSSSIDVQPQNRTRRARTESGSQSQGASQSQNKSQLDKYLESKPLSCVDANRSRLVSARRHVIENVNCHLKKFKFFYNVVSLHRMKSGFALASIKVCLSIMNRRFLIEKKMIMDQDPHSFLPNLERALLFQSRHEKLSDGTENKFWPIMRDNFSSLFNFRLSTPWIKIGMENQSDLDFPPIIFDSSETAIYDNLKPNHLWYFTLGTYGCKRTCSYLNTVEYERDYFDAQKLNPNSELYNIIVAGLSLSKVHVVRFRVPSMHKPGSINANGYHGVICYHSVESFDPSDPSKFTLKENIPVTGLDKNDYYFANTMVAHWCSCKTGQRTIGSCAHVIAAIVGFGRPSKKYTKPRFQIFDPTIFPN